MAILLYVTPLGRDDALPIIFLAAALFTVIGIWQLFNVFTNFRLSKQFAKRKGDSAKGEEQNVAFRYHKERELLSEPDFENMVPASVTEKTTTNLSEKLKVKSS